MSLTTRPLTIPRSTRRFLAALTTYLLPILFVGLVVTFAILEPRFLDPTNLTNVSRQSVFLLLIALGQMIVLINAQLDLSVGATVAFTSVIVATFTSSAGEGGWSIVIGLLIALAAGLVIGLVNGAIVSFWKVPSFMATLGTTSILTGSALLITKGAPVTGVPFSFRDVFGTGNVFGIPTPVIVGIGVLLLVMLFMNRVPTGRNMYAIGGNAEAARVAGINVRRTVIVAFVLCSVFAALAGMLLTARLGSGEASLGGSYVMLSIAAAVLGGTSLFGGEGVAWRVLLGVLFMGVLGNGMNLLHISSYVQEIVIGCVLVMAVGLERLREKL